MTPARFLMVTIILVYIYIRDSQLNRPESVSLVSLARQSREISIEHPSVGLASLAQLIGINSEYVTRFALTRLITGGINCRYTPYCWHSVFLWIFVFQ